MNGCRFFEIRCDVNVFGLALLVRKSGWRFSLIAIVGPFVLALGAAI